jgi:pSer/pThr/pTyr-binding forkhead associated (FHA) protein
VINLGTNGTYLDGKRITQEFIQDGAIIRLARSGPNIQIRLGDTALQDISVHPGMVRPPASQPDLPLIPTDITRQNPEEEECDRS